MRAVTVHIDVSGQAIEAFSEMKVLAGALLHQQTMRFAGGAIAGEGGDGAGACQRRRCEGELNGAAVAVALVDFWSGGRHGGLMTGLVYV